jgi:polygalacturonase
VHVPAGRIVSGTIHLRSHVSLHLDNGATLAMSADPAAFDPPERLPYDPHADRATPLFHNALIAGEGLENVAIFGQGTIDGNRTRGGGPKTIALKRCRNVSIRGISMLNGPSYHISLLGCEHVDIDGVTIRNGYSDGIDPDCCKFVRIANCFVESVDDAICLKASPSLGERVSTEHVTIMNCVLRTASIHVKCGTESYGDFRNIAISNCALVGGMGNRHGDPGVALYTVDGGTLDGVVFSNVTMQNVGIPIALRLGARGRG